MCNTSNCSHNDLDDSLDDLFGGELSAEDRAHGEKLAAATFSNVSRTSGQAKSDGAFVERCPSCRGTGRFVSYSGRTVGDCFKCKGKGKLTFKTSPQQREASRDAAARAADRKAERIREQVQAWQEANVADAQWIVEKSPSFEFAASMAEALTKYGALTERQHATVTRLRLADAERQAARKVEAEQRAANAPTVDASRIATAFATAQGNGVKRPRMTLDGFKISLAPVTGRNAGALYVVRKADDQYLGKIADGRFQRVRECDAETEAQVVRIINDPKGEAIAYGQRTGNCCICNRELTNHASIDAGIGPICAERFGW